jgi:hypothetical protein
MRELWYSINKRLGGVVTYRMVARGCPSSIKVSKSCRVPRSWISAHNLSIAFVDGRVAISATVYSHEWMKEGEGVVVDVDRRECEARLAIECKIGSNAEETEESSQVRNRELPDALPRD